MNSHDKKQANFSMKNFHNDINNSIINKGIRREAPKMSFNKKILSTKNNLKMKNYFKSSKQRISNCIIN